MIIYSERLDILPIPDKVIYVYSDETSEYTNKLVNLIKNNEKDDIFFMANTGKEVRSRKRIEAEIKGKLDEIQGIKHIHLNFTGGTKAMALHGYLTVNSYAEKNKIEFITSDLDPVEHILNVSTKESGDWKFPSPDDMKKNVQLSINNLLSLHGMDDGKSNGNLGFNYNPKNINEKVNIVRKKYIDEIKVSFKDKNIRKEMKDFNGTLETLEKRLEKKLKNNHLEDNVNNNKLVLDSILEDPEVEKKIDEVFFNKFYDYLSVSVKDSKNIEELRNNVKFLRGGWLEEYIQQKIVELNGEEDFGLDERNIKRSVKATFNNRYCEMDVVVMQGYQLYLFSCTTSSYIKTVKGKAFEAMYRAEQLGGAEAKAIVVSLLPSKGNGDSNMKELEKDLSSFDAKHRVSLIGLEDIQKEDELKEKLIKIFEGGTLRCPS